VARVFLFIMDSFGVGGAPDAASFGDEGSNTFLHIWDKAKPRLPNLAALGLGVASKAATGVDPFNAQLIGRATSATEISKGKDTITGHWEIAGVPLEKDWGYFPKTNPAFPQSLMDELVKRAKLPGLLAMNHASGTEVIEDYGAEHIASGKPIIYTSVDSVIQIAAHETHFGLQRLYDVCQIARDLSYDLNIGRVIARPFLGEKPGAFERTGHRKDYSVLPPSPTLLHHATDAKRDVVTIGKIGDIYAHSGTGREVKVAGLETLMATTESEMEKLKNGGFLMVNFVDFDTQYGHRRDVTGYASALEQFDQWLPYAMKHVHPGDRLIITADHGNDPTWQGTDHTRERIPIMCWGPDIRPGAIELRHSFADIGQSIARHLNLTPLRHGQAFPL
jgi:phosphopentomutase